MKCRLCGGETTPSLQRDDIRLYACPDCTFITGDPTRQQETSDRYRHYYRGDPPPAPEYRYQEWLDRAERRVARGRLLEIGAGTGAFVRVALRRGWSVTATEVSESGLAQLRATAADVIAGSVEDARLPAERFDFVVSLEVLEHLPDPAGHLRELARITRPGGLLLLTTPNFNGLSRHWLGARWRVIDPGHIGYFTPHTLRAALKQAGYGDASVSSRSLDLSTWRRAAAKPSEVVTFDPQASARLRDSVQARPALRLARESLHVALGLIGVGDSLLAWARR